MQFSFNNMVCSLLMFGVIGFFIRRKVIRKPCKYIYLYMVRKRETFPPFSIYLSLYLYFSSGLNYILVKGLFKTFFKRFQESNFFLFSFFSLCRKLEEADLKMVCGKAVTAKDSQISFTSFLQYFHV